MTKKQKLPKPVMAWAWIALNDPVIDPVFIYQSKYKMGGDWVRVKIVPVAAKKRRNKK